MFADADDGRALSTMEPTQWVRVASRVPGWQVDAASPGSLNFKGWVEFAAEAGYLSDASACLPTCMAR